MLSFNEVVKRALTGPICKENDFDLKVFVPKLKEVTKKYGIKYDPKNPVSQDDEAADRLFQAAIDFYSEVGTYCVDTERRMIFDRSEIIEALQTAPSGHILGEGREAKRLIARKPESPEPPWCSLGAAGAPISDETILSSLVEAYAKLPLIDSVTTPALSTIGGIMVQGGTPLEIEGSIRAVILSREALRRAGKPGLPIVNGVATAVTDTATIAAGLIGMRRCDVFEIGAIAELKINLEALNKIACILSFGSNTLAETGPSLGGFCGGPEGTAITVAAYHLQGILVHRGSFHHPFPLHFKYGCNTGRDLIWVLGSATQAITRNSHFPMLNLGYIASGPATDMALYETAAWVIGSVVSGGNIEAEGVATATHIDHLTPLEPMFASEVAHAAAGMSRGDANELVNKLVSKYENRFNNPPLGKKYQECFDIHTGTPSAEYRQLYNKIREEVASMGLKFRYNFII